MVEQRWNVHMDMALVTGEKRMLIVYKACTFCSNIPNVNFLYQLSQVVKILNYRKPITVSSKPFLERRVATVIK